MNPLELRDQGGYSETDKIVCFDFLRKQNRTQN